MKKDVNLRQIFIKEVIMEISLDLNTRYTYADYLTWLDGEARELIHGFIKKMSPAPRLGHARVVKNIYRNFDAVVKRYHGKCEVFFAPFDVRFPKHGETGNDNIDTVVQPDICVVCDESKLDELGCCGAPDMIVEVLSPSTTKKDVTEKFALYEENGVKEYWIVHPKEKAINVFLLQDDGKYNAGVVYELEGTTNPLKVPVHVFDDYLIDLNEIFSRL